MKIIILVTLTSVLNIMNAQVRIGEKSITANPDITNTSVLLEFGDTHDKGIILPYVETVPTGTNNSKGGTFIFDASSNTEYKIKVKNENTGWTDLSVQSGYSTTVEATVKVPQASPLTDHPNAKTVIGNSATTTDGILVLDSNDKAMVLPIVTDFMAIKNPSPGMLAFIKHPTDSSKHRLILFNGQKWTFWKP